MKKTLFRSAMLAMVIAAAVMATSCQKEKEKEENMKMTVSHFNPADLQIEDMNAYLEGFKEKMKNASTKGSTETMGIEEAAWHLSSVANYELANIGASHDTLRFDTLYCHIDVTDGMISIADMNAAYEEMSHAIVNFKKGLGCENPNFWFIGTKISENGEITIPLTTMFTANCSKYWGTHFWSFSNQTTADSICALYFDNTTTYYADSNAMSALEYALALSFTHQLVGGEYLTYYTTKEYKYQNHTDAYGSNFYGNSRLYASTNYYHSPISYENMCYAFDSYSGLAITDSYMLPYNPIPTTFLIEFLPAMRLPCVGNHKLTIEYCHINGVDPTPGPGGENW